jgi:hypothetical protein
LENKTGIPRFFNGTGKLFILMPATQPATDHAADAQK